MKDEKRKKILELAEEIIKLEYLCQTQPEFSNEHLAKMEQLTQGLSFEEMLEIDEYIYEKLFDKNKNL